MRYHSGTVVLHTFGSPLALNVDHCSSVSIAISAQAKQIRSFSHEKVLYAHCRGQATAWHLSQGRIRF